MELFISCLEFIFFSSSSYFQLHFCLILILLLQLLPPLLMLLLLLLRIYIYMYVYYSSSFSSSSLLATYHPLILLHLLPIPIHRSLSKSLLHIWMGSQVSQPAIEIHIHKRIRNEMWTKTISDLCLLGSYLTIRLFIIYICSDEEK